MPIDLPDLAEPWRRLAPTIGAVADDVVGSGMWIGVADHLGRLLWQAGTDAPRVPAAIGTSLDLERPTEAAFAPGGPVTPVAWACAAAPVRERQGERLAGCVAIAGPRDAAWTDVVLLVRLTALTLEAELQQALAASA